MVVICMYIQYGEAEQKNESCFGQNKAGQHEILSSYSKELAI